jgi:Tol biopolymer transport system component
LVYQHVVASDAIWRIELKDPRHSVGSPAPLISSRGINWRPSFSPDGKKIVFESDRLGYSDMWYCYSEGTNCSQLTSLRGTAGAGSWSPDGHYVAFEFQSQGYYQVYTVEVPGGQPRLLPTFPGCDNGAPTWSRDGQWIYFYSNHEKGLFQLWKVALSGGSPVQVTSNGGVHAIESDDGHFLYYSKLDQPGLWMAPLNGGGEKRILDQPPGFDWHSWVLGRGGVYYLNARDPQNATIEFFDFRKGESTPIARLKSAESYHGLAASPDGRSLLYVQNESDDSYIMLVKHFH